MKQNAELADTVKMKLESVIEKEVAYVKDKRKTGQEMANAASDSEPNNQLMNYLKDSSLTSSISRKGKPLSCIIKCGWLSIYRYVHHTLKPEFFMRISHPHVLFEYFR